MEMLKATLGERIVLEVMPDEDIWLIHADTRVGPARLSFSSQKCENPSPLPWLAPTNWIL
jgi:hypothetical protein